MAHLLTIVGYIVATLLVQGASHFYFNADHYAAVGFARTEPIFVLGILAMIVQGAILSFVYAWSRFADGSVLSALTMSWLLGGFLASYMAFAQAGEFTVPSVGSWIATELVVAFVQYTLIGALLWLAHRRFGRTAAAAA